MILIRPFANMYVNVCFDVLEFNKAVSKRSKEKSFLVDTIDGMPITLGRFCIIFDKENNPFFIIGIFDHAIENVVHESSHLTTYIMETYNIQDDEFRSYFCAYLADQIILKMPK